MSLIIVVAYLEINILPVLQLAGLLDVESPKDF